MNNTIVIDREMTSKDSILRNVKYKIISNKKELADREDIPTFEFCDIKVGYAIEIGGGPDYTANVIVTNDLLETRDITVENLDKAAMENTENGGILITPIENVLSEFLGEVIETPDSVPQLLVVTTTNKVGGAVAMLLPSVMERVRKTFGEDFYILPSSVHEVLTLPESASDADMLCDMVTSINDTTVLPEERLSYSIYKYSGEKKKVEIAGRRRQ